VSRWDDAMREAIAVARTASAAGDVPIGAVLLDADGTIVTLEPCTMCAGASVLARLDRIVFGAYDPKAGAIASLWDVVRDPRLNHRPAVVGGILAEDCGALLTSYFAEKR
jgi:tRNA(adenine34) deaminase